MKGFRELIWNFGIMGSSRNREVGGCYGFERGSKRFECGLLKIVMKGFREFCGISRIMGSSRNREVGGCYGFVRGSDVF